MKEKTTRDQKETVSAGAEQKEGHMQVDTQRIETQRTDTELLSKEKAKEQKPEEEKAVATPKEEQKTEQTDIISEPGSRTDKKKEEKPDTAQHADKDAAKGQDRLKGKRQPKRVETAAQDRSRERSARTDAADRQKAAGKPLVIPKAALAPGQVEERTICVAKDALQLSGIWKREPSVKPRRNSRRRMLKQYLSAEARVRQNTGSISM